MIARHARSSSLLLLVVTLVPLSGCMRAAKQAYYELRGAKAEVKLVQDVDDAVLRSYQQIVFQPATTTAGEKICPPSLLSKYDSNAREQLRDISGEFPGGSPTLQIATEILYFQEKGIFSSAECLVRVRGRDNGKLVFDAIVKAESKAFTSGGESALTGACAKAVCRYLEKRRKKRPDDEG